MKAQAPKRLEFDELRTRLREAEETLEAIRTGAVDALVVSGPQGERVFTLTGAEHPYRLLVEAMNEGALSLSIDGKILYANAAFAQMLDDELDQVIGRQLIDFATADEQEALSGLIFRARSAPVRADLSLLSSRSRMSMPIQLSLNPGKVDGADFISVVVTDLSERRRSEEARVAVKLRDEFIAMVAHELRNPLSTLLHSVDVLEALAVTPRAETLTQVTQRVGRQIKRMAALTDRLLDVSQLANGQLQLEIHDHDLADIVRELIEPLSEEAAQAECAIDTQIEGGLKIQCDRVRLEQAIVNVVSNAIKYGRGKPIVVSARREQRTAVIHVDDNGVGVAEQDLTRIFDRFERGTGAAQSIGLGLGLYVTREIVKQHGGAIFAQLRPCGGARFTIVVPLKQVEARKS